MLLHGFSAFDLSSRKRLPILLVFFIYTAAYRTESIRLKSICQFNLCSMCINGGTCIPNAAECSPACACPPKFTGHRCQIRKADKPCAKRCSPEACNWKGHCKQDPVTCDLGCDCFNGFRGDTCSLNGHLAIMEINPCFCVHGQCDRSKPGAPRCICDDRWRGDSCNIPCRNGCGRRSCMTILGRKFCT